MFRQNKIAELVVSTGETINIGDPNTDANYDLLVSSALKVI